MITHFKKVFIIFIVAIAATGSMATDTKIPVAEYRKRLLGDNAFNSGLYDVAMSYYKNYLKDADGNSPAIRDAYYCLIATCLRSNKLTEAQRLYNELKLKFQYYFSSNLEEERILEYWNAEILLKKGDINNASIIFEDITNNASADQKELKTDALIGLGICKIRQSKWDQAKVIFEKLDKVPTERAKEVSIQQLIYINIIQGNVKEAEKLLRNTIEDHKQLSLKLELLKLCSLIKNNKLDEAEKEYLELKELAKAPDPIWYIISTSFANAYIKEKNYKKAIPLLEDASIMSPNLYYKERTSLNLIKALYEAKQPNKAIKTAVFFLDNFPHTANRDKIILLLLEIMIKEKKYQEAAANVSKYFLFNPKATQDKIQIALDTGKILFHLKKYEEANKYFSYIANSNSTEKEAGLYWKAKALIEQNKLKDALDILLTLDKNKNTELDEQIKYKIIEIYIKQKNYNKAAQALKSFISDYPNTTLTPSPVFLYAITLKKLGQTNDAIAKLELFAQKNPDNPNTPLAYLEAGYLSVLQDDYIKAKELFNKILTQYRSSTQTPDALYWLLYTNYLDGNENDSEEYASSLLKQYPDSVFTQQALQWQINYYIDSKQYKKATASLDTLEKIFTDKPDMKSETIYMKAYVLYREGKKEEALKTIKELEDKYSITPILAKSLYLKGDILASEGEYLDAIASYLKSTQVTDNLSINLAAWGRVGDCYFAMINYIKERSEREDTLYKAIEYYDKILAENEISPLFKIQTLYKLGKCFELLDRPEEALIKYHEAVYSNILSNNDEETPCREWFAKSGIALARLLQDKHTPIAAEAAISVYKTLIKYNIQPKQDFEQRIKEISRNYKLKE